MAEEETEKIKPTQEVVQNPPAPAPAAAALPANPNEANTKPHPRTPGLRLFDVFLYPGFTYGVVTAMSVAATYLTQKGHIINPRTGKPLYGKLGQWFHDRGNNIVNAFKGAGMSEEQAKMGNMVAWSFIDGTFIAPFVKVAEDRRERISKRLDDWMGTTPEDELAAYKEEPKQSWLSVVGGRIGTASVVVPTAIALDKTGLNDVLFHAPGERFGEWAAKKPGVVRFFEKLRIPREGIPMIGKVGAFEAFYTAVCTVGLYFGSRFLAKMTNLKKPGEFRSILDENGHDFTPELLAATRQEKAGADAPDTRITAAHLADRAQPQTAMERL